MKSNHVKQALDNTLSGLYVTKKDAYKLLENAKGEVKVKKKISLALVLVIALLIISAGAVAAVILNSREFVDQIVTPMAETSTTEKWTEDEIASIIQLAEKNGVPIPDAVRDAAAYGEMEKESLILSFAKNDLDPFVGAWSIEDQAWYDQLMVRLGYHDAQTHVLPEGDELSEDKIMRAVISYIHDKFGVSDEILDGNMYKKYTEYRQLLNEDGSFQPRKWYISIQSNDPTKYRYDFTVTPAGIIDKAVMRPGARSMSGAASDDDILDYYYDRYGRHYQWTQDVWEALQQDMKRSVEKHGLQGNLSVFLTRQEYGTPDNRSISKDDAIDAAFKAISAQSNISDDELKKEFTHTNALYLVGKNSPVWKVALVNEAPSDGGRTYDLRYAEVDAVSGEVLNTGHYNPGAQQDSSPYYAYFLEEITDPSNWPAQG